MRVALVRRRHRGARGMAGALVCGWAIAGCGAPPPQVPTALANPVADSVSNIALACGEADQQFALPGLPTELAPLQRSARRAGLILVHIERRNPHWIYQGDTLAQLVALSVRDLYECHLAEAATQIKRATG